MIKTSLFADQEREAKLNKLGDALRVMKQPSKRERQIQAIVKEALAQGFDVLSIPSGGKAQIRKQCMQTQPGLFGAGLDPFKEAWQKALDQNRVRTENHHRYVK